MAPIPARSTARERRSRDWRGELGLVIEGEVTIVSRHASSSQPVQATASSAREPRWGAALHAANSNQKRPASPRKARSLGIWASLGLQTGAALAGLAVLGLVVFPHGGSKPVEAATASVVDRSAR